MKYYLSIILIFVLAIQTFAFDAKVMSKSGKVYVKSNNSWTDVRVGGTLNLSDSIKLESGSMDLLFKSGGTTRMDGTKTILLKNGIPKKSKNVTSKFAEYLESELTQSESLLSKDKKNMNVTGSVTRNFEELGPLKIKLHSPLKIFFKSNDVNFIWTDNDTTQTQYEVIVTNRFGNLQFSKTISNKTIKFNTEIESLENDEYYFIKVKKGKLVSNQTCFLVLSENRYEELADTITLIKEQNLEGALKYIIIASYFEHHNLILESVEAYEELISKYNEDYYIELYKRFLQRNNLIRLGI